MSEWCDSYYSHYLLFSLLLIDKFKCLKVRPKIYMENKILVKMKWTIIFVPEKLKQTPVFISAISLAFVSNQDPDAVRESC